MMKIGVLGSGMVGQTIASRLLELGHEVMVGTRDPGKLNDWLNKNPKAGIGSFAETATFGETLFNAVSGTGTLNALEMAGEVNLSGKVLIDISNPLDFSNGFPPSLSVSNTDSLAEQIQRNFPKAKVVKALNTVTAHIMIHPEELANGEHTTFICGNDADAREQTVDLLRSFGWKDIFDLGDLSAARGLEAYLLLWVRMYGSSQNAMINIKVHR